MSVEDANRIAKAAERARRRTRAPMKLVLPTVAALGAGAAVAVGSIPSSDGTITGCYQTIDQGTDGGPYTPYGTLRLIDPSSSDPQQNSCVTGTEQTITWNQRGPTGPQGPPGQNGAQGPAGPAGPPGTVQAQSSPGSELFLTLSGISGESTNKLATGDIALDSFSLQTSRPSTIGSATGGAGAGKVNFANFKIVKPLDKSSPTLFNDLVTGKHIDKATISVDRNERGKLVRVAEYTLSTVFITSIHDSGSGDETSEAIEGEYQKIQFGVVSTQGDGATSTTNSGWNRVKNTTF